MVASHGSMDLDVPQSTNSLRDYLSSSKDELEADVKARKVHIDGTAFGPRTKWDAAAALSLYDLELPINEKTIAYTAAFWQEKTAEIKKRLVDMDLPGADFKYQGIETILRHEGKRSKQKEKKSAIVAPDAGFEDTAGEPGDSGGNDQRTEAENGEVEIAAYSIAPRPTPNIQSFHRKLSKGTLPFAHRGLEATDSYLEQHAARPTFTSGPTAFKNQNESIVDQLAQQIKEQLMMVFASSADHHATALQHHQKEGRLLKHDNEKLRRENAALIEENIALQSNLEMAKSSGNGMCKNVVEGIQELDKHLADMQHSIEAVKSQINAGERGLESALSKCKDLHRMVVDSHPSFE